MDSKDYYSILGVSKNATPNEIKKAYKSLSKRYHPDINKSPDAEDKFKEINEAYSVLSDSEKKRMYDTYGTTDPQDAFGGGFDPFGSDFNPFAGFSFRNKTRVKEKGDDLKIKIDVDFEDLFYGVHKKVEINKKCTCHRCNGSGSESNATSECPHCHGTGYITETYRRGNMISQQMTPCPHCHGRGTIIDDPCPNCGGTGLENKMTNVEFDIPAGMYENAYFIVRGEGNDGPHRGTPGDLLVIVNELPSKNGLIRDPETNDILYTLKVPYKNLVFGSDVEVPYINGNKKIHIEAGTESGKVLKLYRMGFPNPNDNTQKSDYIITVECYIPKEKELSKEQKKRIKEL